jgi:excisionase family DNA binding protein
MPVFSTLGSKGSTGSISRRLAGGAMSALADEMREACRQALREELARLLPPLLAELGRPVQAATAALLRVPEAAQRLGLATSTVYKLAERCELPSVLLGRRRLFRPADLDTYAAERRSSPGRVRDLAEEAKGR